LLREYFVVEPEEILPVWIDHNDRKLLDHIVSARFPPKILIIISITVHTLQQTKRLFWLFFHSVSVSSFIKSLSAFVNQIHMSHTRQNKITMSPNVVPKHVGDTTYTKIFVGGLAWETKRDTLKRYFDQFGDILEAVVITDRTTGKSKGYGFVICTYSFGFNLFSYFN